MPVIVAVMPKCGFCILAYSGTMAMCGAGLATESYHQTSSRTALIVVTIFGLITLISVLINRRGFRTFLALILVTSGLCLTTLSMMKGGGSVAFYSGAVLMLLGVWTNSSLISMIRQFSSKQHSTCSISTKHQ